jgi:hypothetical protein
MPTKSASLSLRHSWRRTQSARPDAARTVIDLFAGDAETAVLIARAYRQSGHRRAEAHQRLAGRLLGAGSAAETLARLRRGAREDLGRGRAFNFDGWLLAETEAEACVLLAPEA